MRLQLTATALAALLFAPGRLAAQDGPSVRSDTLVYSDSDNVLVVTPQVSVAQDLDDEGGRLGARTAVDVISAASVDVVSQATTRFSEVRTEVGLTAQKSVRDLLPALSYRFSTEPDYVSHGGRVGLTLPIRSKDTTLSGGYGLTVDRVGRSGTPFSVFSESLRTHAVDLSLTQVFGVKTVGRLAYTFTGQVGYMEKPYRYVPLFTRADLDQAAMDGVSLDLDSFTDYALPARPPEEVPDRRYRNALSLRLLRYLPEWSASARLDYQLYLDSWGVLSNLAEPSLYFQLGESWRARGFVRVYHQRGADFWEKTYVVEPGLVPRWRTLDRSLTSYLSASAGARVEWEKGPFSTYLESQSMWTSFYDYLFLDTRLALIGQLGAQWTF